MKTLLRLTASTALSLSMGAVAFGQHYTQTNLVSNVSGVAPVTDPQLVNPWGLSRGSGSAWWVADNLTGVATLYNGPGAKQSLVVTIPPADPNNKKTPTGSPTGTIFNSSPTDFLLAPGMQSTFLFSTVDGTIAGWNANVAVANGATPPSTHAVTMVKTTDGSSYTGLTSAFIGNQRFLYAANFTKGRVDVYDHAFHRVNLQGVKDPFVDDLLPRDFVPFNVQAIGNDIVVTYVLHEDGSPFESDGPGLGRVDIYSSDGLLLQRLEHGDWLNAPWGVALAPLDFGRFSHDLLVAQFAGGGTTENSGVIAAYDLATGKFDGLLQDASGKTLAIPGIWAISQGNVTPLNSDPAASPAAQLYFTAVPNGGGLFGYLTAVSTDLTEGNAQ
jgi:uncharacterized protein (TIGR03118 family)